MTTIESPNVIHIEPSVDGQHGFPMEIGLALHNRATYCLVTLPEDAGHAVDPAVEQATGLTRGVRESRGRPLVDVAAEINRVLEGDTVYVDGEGPGEQLLRRLFETAGVAPSFTIAPVQVLLDEDRRRDWQRACALELEEQDQIRNRASDRALIIQQTVLRGLDSDSN